MKGPDDGVSMEEVWDGYVPAGGPEWDECCM